MRHIPEVIQQINPEALATLHRQYFGDPSEPGYTPPEDALRDVVFWANEGGADEDDTQTALRVVGFIKDLFSPVRTYGLSVPDPDAGPAPTPKAA